MRKQYIAVLTLLFCGEIMAFRARATDQIVLEFVRSRNRRAVVSTLMYTGCGHWSDWISRNTPNVSSSPNENEHFTNNDLDVLCPSAGGYTVNGFRCKDEKGEPIHDIINETDVSHTYVHTCSNMFATCVMLNAPNFKEKCPDFAIQIKCECPPTPTTATANLTGAGERGNRSATMHSPSGSDVGHTFQSGTSAISAIKSNFGSSTTDANKSKGSFPLPWMTIPIVVALVPMTQVMF